MRLLATRSYNHILLIFPLGVFPGPEEQAVRQVRREADEGDRTEEVQMLRDDQIPQRPHDGRIKRVSKGEDIDNESLFLSEVLGGRALLKRSCKSKNSSASGA